MSQVLLGTSKRPAWGCCWQSLSAKYDRQLYSQEKENHTSYSHICITNLAPNLFWRIYIFQENKSGIRRKHEEYADEVAEDRVLCNISKGGPHVRANRPNKSWHRRIRGVTLCNIFGNFSLHSGPPEILPKIDPDTSWCYPDEWRISKDELHPRSAFVVLDF